MTRIADPVTEGRVDRALRWADECRQFAALAFVSSRSERIGRMYDIVGTANLFGEASLYINLGYWAGNPGTLDEASDELARLVARAARLGADDVVLDVGSGYGEQDLLWLREFGPARITGVNVAHEQVKASRSRVAALGLADRIDYEIASAMDLPRPDATVSKVVALESPFHFPSQRRFFAEALRVLEPGGRLVTADIIPRGRLPLAVGNRELLDRSGYRRALLAAGFATADVYSIRRQVYSPLAKFLRGRLRDPDMRAVNPLLRIGFSPTGVRLWSPWVDYVIAVAVK